jgi:general secretion pathway protein G
MTATRTNPDRIRRGFTLLELVLVMSLITAISGIAMIAGGQYLQGRWESATREEIENLTVAVRSFYRDTGSFPSQLSQLATNSPAVTGWRGPYVSPDVAAVGGSYLADAWGRLYQYSIVDATSFRIGSYGRNGIDDEGEGDDLSAKTDVTDLARIVTDREINELNLAIQAYNVFNLPSAPLSGGYSSVLSVLSSQKYVLNSDHHLDTDGFGRQYLVGPSPVQYVTASGN